MAIHSIMILVAGALFWSAITSILVRLYRWIVIENRREFWLLAVLNTAFLLGASGVSLKTAGEYLVSDSIEYALSASQLAETGEYLLPFTQREKLPPRFPIWLSLVVVAPCNVILGPDPRNGIAGIIGCLCITSWAASLLAFKIEGSRGLALSGFILPLVPGFTYFSRTILTEIPNCALFLLLALLYLYLDESLPNRMSYAARRWGIFASGVLISLLTGFRSIQLLCVFPQLILILRTPGHLSSRAFDSILLSAPILCVLLASFFMNFHTFGSPLFTGYHYWIPVPYHFLNQVFSLQFIAKTSPTALVESGIIIWIIVSIFALQQIYLRKREAFFALRKSLSAPLAFMVSGCLPLLAAYTLYFYSTLRFTLPIAVLGAAVSAGIFSHLFFSLRRSLSIIMFICLSVIGVALQKTTPITLSPLISSIKTLCTPDTTLVSALNPLLLEYTLGHTCKTIVPFDRSVEFASHAVIKKYGDKPHAEEDSRNYSLRNQGTDVYEATFSEHPVRGRFLFETSALSKEQIISAQTLLDLQPTSIPSLFWAQTKHTSVDK